MHDQHQRDNAAGHRDDHWTLARVIETVRESEPAAARKWFDELEAEGIDAGCFGIRAQSDMHRDYLRRSCLSAFNDALGAVTGQLMPVRFLGPADHWSRTGPGGASSPSKDGSSGGSADGSAGGSNGRAPSVIEPSPTRHARSELVRLESEHALPISPDNTFDEFVIGPNNQLAHAASLAVSDQPGEVYNPLFIHGGVGLGKTHLLHAICLRILTNQPDIRVHYVSCDGFRSQFLDAVHSGKMAEFRHTFRDVDLLVIDDIHFLADRDRSQEEFFNTFNALYQANKQIVLSSDAPPDEIPDLEERLVSRFAWGVVAKMGRPGFETRAEILRRKALSRGLEIPEPVAYEIATHIDTNIRELEAAINQLQFCARVHGKNIDMDLATEALGEAFAAATRAQADGPSIERIISEIVSYYSIKRSELLGKRRLKSIALPRQVGMYLARHNTRHSLEEIGAHFGGRDHTTVMHAVRTIGRKADENESLRNDLHALEARLRIRAGV